MPEIKIPDKQFDANKNEEKCNDEFDDGEIYVENNTNNNSYSNKN
jgi:hypothetical protein